MNLESSNVPFFPSVLFPCPPARVVYLCNKLPEGVGGMLNLYEPDSLTSRQNSMQTQTLTHAQTYQICPNFPPKFTVSLDFYLQG